MLFSGLLRRKKSKQCIAGRNLFANQHYASYSLHVSAANCIAFLISKSYAIIMNGNYAAQLETRGN